MRKKNITRTQDFYTIEEALIVLRKTQVPVSLINNESRAYADSSVVKLGPKINRVVGLVARKQ